MSKGFVLITGATGHIGFRTLVELLEAGYSARVSTRQISQAAKVKAAASIKPHLDRVEFVEVPDITAVGAFDVAVHGVEYILHLASPIPDYSLQGNVKDLYLNPAIQGTLSMLESASKVSSVKRVVITSSIVILALDKSDGLISPNDMAPVPNPDKVGPSASEGYRASKVLAYEAAQNFMRTHDTSFDLIHILPAYVQGRNEIVDRKEDVGNGSNDVMIDVVLGKKASRPRLATVVWVNDVAKVEVAALDPTKGKNGDRFIAAYPEGIQWEDVLPIARTHFAKEVDEGILPLGGSQQSIPFSFDVSATTKTFDIEFADLETMVKSLVGQYIELASSG